MNKVFKKIIKIIPFALFSFIALQIPFTNIFGSNSRFTLFDFTAPSLGALIGPYGGILSVLLGLTANIIYSQGSLLEVSFLARLIPALFAVFIFVKPKSIITLAIPTLGIIFFNLHPIGRSAWQYSLLWLIPVFSRLFTGKTYARALTATFSAHTIGSLSWLYLFGLSKEVWLALIPQVIMERLLFAGGISAFYLLSLNFKRLFSLILRGKFSFRKS